MAKAAKVRSPWDRDDDISILKTYDMETGQIEVLQRFPFLIEAPNWTPDGKALIFNSLGKMVRYDLSSGQTATIPTGDADDCNNDHVLSPDGMKLGISHVAHEVGLSRVYVVDSTGGEPVLITPQAPSYLHGYSPDGQELAYCAERGGEFDVYTVPVGGGEEKRLTTAPGLNDGPEYDPDGEHIWFNSVRSGLMQVWRMKRDGSEQTQMTFDEQYNAWFPHVSPNGQWVVMVAYHKGDVKPAEHLPHKQVAIRLMDRNGGELRTIIELFGGQGTMNVNSWSPDSRKFAFVTYELPEA